MKKIIKWYHLGRLFLGWGEFFPSFISKKVKSDEAAMLCADLFSPQFSF